MVPNFDPLPNPVENPSYQQLAQSMARLQQNARNNPVPTQRRNSVPPDLANPAKPVGDRVQISQEALAKARASASSSSGAQTISTSNVPSLDSPAAALQSIEETLAIIARSGSSSNTNRFTRMMDDPNTMVSTRVMELDDQNPAVEFGASKKQAEEILGEQEETTSSAKTPALAETTTLAGVTISNIREVTDSEGNRIGATGEVDLSQYGLGKVAVDLTLENGQVVGATSQQNQMNANVGGNSFTISAQNGDNLLTINQQDGITLAGRVNTTIGGQQIEIRDASISFRTDAQNNRELAIQGTYGQAGSQTQISATFNSSGVFTAQMSMEALNNFAPGFDKVTGFLSAVGVDVNTQTGASIAYNKNDDSLAIDAFGIQGSYNHKNQEFSIGGLSAGAGISLSLDDLTVNMKTGKVSGSVAAGIGVGVGDLGIGVNLANFSFDYDPANGAITLGGSVGIASANLQVSASLRRGSNGQYGVSSVQFNASVNDQLGKEIAKGLNEAYKQGTALGKEAINQFQQIGQQGQQAVENFAKGLQQAGGRMGDYIIQSKQLAGKQLTDFLSAAASAGNSFGTFLDETKKRTGQALNDFLSDAASSTKDIAKFLQSGGKKVEKALTDVGGSVVNFFTKSRKFW